MFVLTRLHAALTAQFICVVRTLTECVVAI